MDETIGAQVLYDERERNAQISGTDLHNLFRMVCNGEPSPSGYTPISVDALVEIMHTTGDPDMSQFIQDVING